MNHIFEEIHGWRRQNLAALWITGDCDVLDARALLSLDWPLVWSALSPDDRARTLETLPDRYQVINSRAELPPEGRSGTIRYVYDVAHEHSSTPSALLRARRAAELENLLEGWVGAVVVAGELTDELIALVTALAPGAKLYGIGVGDASVDGTACSALANWLVLAEQSPEGFDSIDLKDAPGVQIDPTLLHPISDAWELVTRRTLNPDLPILQEDFDAFLSGDSLWRALSAGAAMERGPICRSDNGRIDLVRALLRVVRKVDRDELDPNDALSRLRIFAETGSGCTTVLRQAALAVARAGYPVLITQPFARALRAADVSRIIVSIQEEWARQRQGKGSGAGTLPFCLILDADAELASQAESFIRALSSDLNRKLVIMTAHRRSRSEISESRGTFKLYARTSKHEILAIGRTLRAFCERWKLAAIPSEPEWEAYYASFGHLQSHELSLRGGVLDTPALFLIGLYPFVKERIRDQRSLSRYFYSRWSGITDPGSRRLIEVLAAAAAYGCAVPLECLMREPTLSEAATSLKSKEDERTTDLFVDWARYGEHTRNWALHMRHPALGVLLIRAILPQEAFAPFSPLQPVLELMSGAQSDVWFAEQLAYRLGQYFQSGSPRFSLESDTPIQEAARSIFDAIPDVVASQSRVINHHHARYYIHLLHACLELIQNPSATQVPRTALKSTAQMAILQAERLLQTAREVPQSRERISNLLTTLAAAALRVAGVMNADDRIVARDHVKKAISLARDAIADDIANGHAIYTYVNSIQKLFEAIDLSEITAEEALQLFISAEDRIHTLFELNGSRLWRNVEAEDAELSIHRLVEEHNLLARRLDKSPLVRALVLRTPGARAAVALRQILRGDSLRQAFAKSGKAEALRELRAELADNPIYTGLQDLRYRLQVCDPVGRFDFETRCALLDEMALNLPDDYAHYLHDHAALTFQLEQVERSDELFRQVRISKTRDPDQWMWHNERIFVSRNTSGIEPRRVVVRIIDPLEGWASYERRVKVKIQPRQWGEIRKDDYLNVFLRFRLTGLQAVDRKLAAYDLATMGIAPAVQGIRK